MILTWRIYTKTLKEDLFKDIVEYISLKWLNLKNKKSHSFLGKIGTEADPHSGQFIEIK